MGRKQKTKSPVPYGLSFGGWGKYTNGNFESAFILQDNHFFQYPSSSYL